jgi:hypothetical protein
MPASEFFPTLGSAVLSPLSELWSRFLLFLPALIGALIILVIGWIIAIGLERIVVQIFKQLKIDPALNRWGFKTFFKHARVNFETSDFLGALVKWAILLVTFLAAADVLGLDKISSFLNNILLYVPSVFVAIGILLLGFLIGSFVGHIVRGTLGATRIKSASLLASAAKWTIFIFSILIALNQLGIASAFINQFITAVLFGIALAGALAFGIGGQKAAARWLDEIEKEASHREK